MREGGARGEREREKAGRVRVGEDGGEGTDRVGGREGVNLAGKTHHPSAPA